MIPTQKQLCIAEQAAYGLRCLDDENQVQEISAVGEINTLHKFDLHFKSHIVSYPICGFIYEVKPILRPMSDLTKEITHKGYNKGEPFVPLVELAKIATNFEYEDYSFDGHGVNCETRPEEQTDEIYIPQEMYYFDWDKLNICEFDFLNMLHFDTRNLISTCDAVSTDTINPYKV